MRPFHEADPGEEAPVEVSASRLRIEAQDGTVVGLEEKAFGNRLNRQRLRVWRGVVLETVVPDGCRDLVRVERPVNANDAVFGEAREQKAGEGLGHRPDLEDRSFPKGNRRRSIRPEECRVPLLNRHHQRRAPTVPNVRLRDRVEFRGSQLGHPASSAERFRLGRIIFLRSGVEAAAGIIARDLLRAR